MKIHALILAGTLAVVSGCASGGSVSGGTTYRLKAHEFEGCECNSVCPCIFSRDTSYGDCKVLMGWSVSEGHYKETDLAGASSPSPSRSPAPTWRRRWGSGRACST